jgi:acyl-CoA synthetase (AMP-forming)/AMP-acid ligase II
MINVAGRKVAPQEIEGLLSQLPMVRHGLVFGVPSRDSERVDDVVAVVNLEREGVLESVIAEMRKKLPAWQRPRDWWVCQDLRPDARGKLSRASWRGRYLAARGG